MMHELAIAESIVKFVLEEAEKRHFPKIISINVRIGILTEIVPDSLQFGFETITKESPLQGANLNIVSVPIKAVCLECKNEFEVVDFLFVCPKCSSGNIKVLQGNEIEITGIEIEDEVYSNGKSKD